MGPPGFEPRQREKQRWAKRLATPRRLWGSWLFVLLVHHPKTSLKNPIDPFKTETVSVELINGPDALCRLAPGGVGAYPASGVRPRLMGGAEKF